jgi:hypothetical protein
VDICGFIAVKTQSGRHDERLVVICSQFLKTDPLQEQKKMRIDKCLWPEINVY